MPDRYGDRDEPIVPAPIPLDDDTAHLSAAEIANCTNCDADGYRGHRVCDHRRHASTETRESAMASIRRTLGTGAAR